jgi:hypothetical protein
MARKLVFEDGTVAELEMDGGIPSLTFHDPIGDFPSEETRHKVEVAMGDNFLGSESCMGMTRFFLNFKTLKEVIDFLRGKDVKFSVKAA